MEAEILEYDIPGIWTLGRSYRNEPRTGDGRHLSEFALKIYSGLGTKSELKQKREEASPLGESMSHETQPSLVVG